MDISTFETKLAAATDFILELWQDPAHAGKAHYRFPGIREPLSVTPEEGRILFALARAVLMSIWRNHLSMGPCLRSPPMTRSAMNPVSRTGSSRKIRLPR